MAKHKHEKQETVDLTNQGSSYEGIPVIQKDGVVSQETPVPGLSDIDIVAALEVPVMGTVSEEELSKANPLPPGEVKYVPPITEVWSDIKSAPRNGTPITVSDGTNETNAYWKRTRCFANATHRWEETGFFAGELSGQKIPFDPTMWKVRERRR